MPEVDFCQGSSAAWWPVVWLLVKLPLRYLITILDGGGKDDVDDDGGGDGGVDDNFENVDIRRRKAEFPGLPSLAFHPLSGDIYTG